MKRERHFWAGGFVPLVLAATVVAPTIAGAAGSSLMSVARTSSESKYNDAPWDFASWIGLTGPGFEGAVVTSPFERRLSVPDVVPTPGAILLVSLGLFALARCRRRILLRS